MRLFTNLVFLVVLILSLGAADAFAQRGGGGGRGGQGGGMSMMTAGGMTPDYMLRDLSRFKEALSLTEEQVQIVEQILREYDEAFREASEMSQQSMGDSFRSMRPSEDDPSRQRDEEIRNEMRQLREKLNSARNLGDDAPAGLIERLEGEIEGLREESSQARSDRMQSPERQAAFEVIALIVNDQLRLKRKMRTEFESDLVAILTEEQLSFWPPLQRQLVRDRLLPRGRLMGETVDVMGLVQDQEYDDEVLMMLLPVLSQWDEQVTIALTDRDNHLVENQARLMSSFTSGDSDGSVSIMKTQANLAESVRDLNNSAVSDIALLLAENEGVEFTATARERGYPRIYRLSRAQRAFKAALELDSLEEDILKAIQDLYVSFEMEIAYANEQIYAATLRWESQEQLDRMTYWSSRMRGGDDERAESPIEKAEESKRKIENSYIEQLKGLLTPEQIEALGGLETNQGRERGGWGGNWGRSDRSDRDREQGREEFMKQFDKNGNGQIDEDERQGIRDAFRNGGQGGGPGMGGRGGQGGGPGMGGRGGQGGGRGGQGGGGRGG